MTKRQLYIKTLVFLGLRFERSFIRELARIEYGVAHYARKLADESPEYRRQFLAHATSEKNHGRMLAASIGEEPESKGGMAGKRYAYTEFAGKTQVDGVGKRYAVFRKILRGRSLSEFRFVDRICVMAALESIAGHVYLEISKQARSPFREIAAKIAQDESRHHSYLTEILGSMGYDLDIALAWEQVIISSIPCIVFDIPKLFFKH